MKTTYFNIAYFIIVLVFNLGWLLKYGLKKYLAYYKWKNTRWLSIILWTYTIWGIINLIYVIIK